MRATSLNPGFVSTFLRADADTFYDWVTRRQSQIIGFCVLAIIAGSGTYGAVMGSWSAPVQALYAASSCRWSFCWRWTQALERNQFEHHFVSSIRE